MSFRASAPLHAKTVPKPPHPAINNKNRGSRPLSCQLAVCHSVSHMTEHADSPAPLTHEEKTPRLGKKTRRLGKIFRSDLVKNRRHLVFPASGHKKICRLPLGDTADVWMKTGSGGKVPPAALSSGRRRASDSPRCSADRGSPCAQWRRA